MAFFSFENFGLWSQGLGYPTIPVDEPEFELEKSITIFSTYHGYITFYIITGWGCGLAGCFVVSVFPPPPRGLFERRIFIKGIKSWGLGAVLTGDTYQELEGSALLRCIDLEFTRMSVLCCGE